MTRPCSPACVARALLVALWVAVLATGLHAAPPVDPTDPDPDPGPEGCISAEDCDDGDVCNGAERCIGRLCRPALPSQVCRDFDPCTSDSCANNECIHEPIPNCPPTTTTTTTSTTTTTRPASTPGELTYAGCFADDATGDCIDLPDTPLTDSLAVAVSPDGGSVYVAAFDAGSVSHFRRDPAGELAFAGCLANDATDGCVELPEAPLRGAHAVAVSPDGASVYVASAQAGSISHFVRGPDGALAYDGCLADDPIDGCVNLPETPLASAHGVAVSPDGASVYVTSGGFSSNSLTHFLRDAQGRLTYGGCLANDAIDGCVNLPDAPLEQARAVAVSPDGASVYVVSPGANSLAHFVRGAQGALTYDGCVADDDRDGCVDLPDAPLTAPYAVAVSPDGTSVYVASPGANSIAHFHRDPQGRLTYGGCQGDSDANGCLDLPETPITSPVGVAVSPDGTSVYVASVDASSIVAFRRGAQGALTYDGCLADNADDGCVDLSGSSLLGGRAVVVSPDGGAVYAVSSYINSVLSWFHRVVPPPPPSSTTTTSLVSHSTTTSTTVTTTTTTTTVPGPTAADCPPGPSFAALECRLDALHDRLEAASGLGKLQGRLLGAVRGIQRRVAQAGESCAAGTAKRTRRQLREASRHAGQYADRLRSKRARRQIEESLRAGLVAASDAIRRDVDGLRTAVSCPAG